MCKFQYYKLICLGKCCCITGNSQLYICIYIRIMCKKPLMVFQNSGRNTSRCLLLLHYLLIASWSRKLSTSNSLLRWKNWVVYTVLLISDFLKIHWIPLGYKKNKVCFFTVHKNKSFLMLKQDVPFWALQWDFAAIVKYTVLKISHSCLTFLLNLKFWCQI